MKFKLSTRDVLELSLAVKCGTLDTDKVECLRAIVEGYSPTDGSAGTIDSYDICYYKRFIEAVVGSLPTPYKEWSESLSDTSRQRINEEKGDIRTAYNEWMRDIFWGVVAMCFLGMHYTGKDNVDGERAYNILQEYFAHLNDNTRYIVADKDGDY